jgi:IS30 family transposase
MAKDNVIPYKRPHRLSTALRDHSYRWQERDPDLEWICRQITRSNLSNQEISQKVSAATGGVYAVSTNTIYQWLNGKTRRPQNHTLTWVAFALGYEKQWRKLQ